VDGTAAGNDVCRSGDAYGLRRRITLSAIGPECPDNIDRYGERHVGIDPAVRHSNTDGELEQTQKLPTESNAGEGTLFPQNGCLATLPLRWSSKTVRNTHYLQARSPILPGPRGISVSRRFLAIMGVHENSPRNSCQGDRCAVPLSTQAELVSKFLLHVPHVSRGTC
jgi:hypothetical protein